jgi:hypothetical protein
LVIILYIISPLGNGIRQYHGANQSHNFGFGESVQRFFALRWFLAFGKAM